MDFFCWELSFEPKPEILHPVTSLKLFSNSCKCFLLELGSRREVSLLTNCCFMDLKLTVFIKSELIELFSMLTFYSLFPLAVSLNFYSLCLLTILMASIFSVSEESPKPRVWLSGLDLSCAYSLKYEFLCKREWFRLNDFDLLFLYS